MVLIQGASSLSPPPAGHYHTITQARITPIFLVIIIQVTEYPVELYLKIPYPENRLDKW